MAHEDHHTDHHTHELDHEELCETLELAETTKGRRKLLVASIGNGVLMLASGITAHIWGAHPSTIESIHDFGDMGYYLTPWLVTLRHHINSRRAARWMRCTAYGAGILAGASIVSNAVDIAQRSYSYPSVYSIGAQAAFAGANGAIALYLGKKSGDSTIDRSTLRHARTDATTSAAAGLFNATAQAMPLLNPVGAAVVGAMTLHTEYRNIIDTNKVITSTADPKDAAG